MSWHLRAYNRASELNEINAFHVIHCHDLDTLLIGIALKRKLGLPLVYDAHEIYGYMATGITPEWACRIFSRLEKRLIRNVDRIITVSEAVEEYFATMTDKAIVIVMNCKPLLNLDYQPPERDKFTLVYVGLLDKTRSIPLLIDVMKKLSDVNCIIGGIGRPDYVQDVKEECSKIPNIKFIGKVPLDQVMPITMDSDCSYLMISEKHLYSSIALGNKQFEAMVCGRPIICTKGTYSGELTEREEVGLAVEYNEEALRQAIIKLRDDPVLRERLGKNALRAAITKYNWQGQEKILLDLYENIESGINKKRTS